MARGADVKVDIAKIAEEEGLTVLGWRGVPINSTSLGKTALSVMPDFHQVFVAGKNGETGIALDRLAFCLRKRAEHALDLYFSSLSSQTIVYKGMLTTGQLKSSSLNFPMSVLSLLLHWFTHVFPQILFLHGHLHTLIALLHTTVKSILLREIATGCALANHYLQAM